VINGEKETGITTMMTDVGLDTGDILLQKSIEILPNETAGELYLRMAELGADVLRETITRLENGTLARITQDHDAATKCATLKKEDGKLDFSLPVQDIHNRVRGVNPWPGAYALFANEPLKIWKTRIPEDIKPQDDLKTGQCFTDAGRLFACCQDGAIEVLELQIAGSKRMEAPAFLRGRSLSGTILA
jgi:methionyl-tRNA formyltransferase